MSHVVIRELTIAVDGKCTLRCQGSGGKHDLDGLRVLHISDSGVFVECPEEMDTDATFLILVRDSREAADGAPGTRAVVVPPSGESPGEGAGIDYYEVLQVSPNADPETIHRVHRIMAARFHPDNPETGDLERFLMMRTAYQVLSDPEARAEYDAARQRRLAEPDPIFGMKDFVVGIEAEVNRRLGVLAVLYNQRRRCPEHPGVTVLELEKQMGFPREHLEFTTWYLKAKKLAAVDDSSAYTLTALGADYVEANAPSNALLERLLRRRSSWAGSSSATPRNVRLVPEQSPNALPVTSRPARRTWPAR